MVLFAKAFGHYPLALTFQEGHLKRAAPGSGKTLSSTIRYSSVTRATSLFSRLFFSKEITFTHSPSPGFDLGLIFFSLISINSYYHDVCGTVWQTRIHTYSWRTFSNITFIAGFSLKLPKSSCFGTLSSVTPAGNSRQQPPIGGQTASPERYVHNEENVSFPRTATPSADFLSWLYVSQFPKFIFYRQDPCKLFLQAWPIFLLKLTPLK